MTEHQWQAGSPLAGAGKLTSGPTLLGVLLGTVNPNNGMMKSSFVDEKNLEALRMKAR